MPAAMDSVRHEFTSGRPNSLFAAYSASKCSGCVFIVSRVNQVLSTSLIVRPGRCSYTSPTWKSSRLRPNVSR